MLIHTWFQDGDQGDTSFKGLHSQGLTLSFYESKHLGLL